MTPTCNHNGQGEQYQSSPEPQAAITKYWYHRRSRRTHTRSFTAGIYAIHWRNEAVASAGQRLNVAWMISGVV